MVSGGNSQAQHQQAKQVAKRALEQPEMPASWYTYLMSPVPESLRVFFAVPPNKAAAIFLHDQLAILQRIEGLKRVRWVGTNNIHLTLRFLGDVDKTRVPELVQAVRQWLPQSRVFTVTLTPAHYFPNARKPTVVACMIRSHPQLFSLVDQIESSVQTIGLAPETRRFRGHITLGRIKRRPVPKHLELPEQTCDMPIGHFQLIKSTLRPEGAVYEVLEDFYLA